MPQFDNLLSELRFIVWTGMLAASLACILALIILANLIDLARDLRAKPKISSKEIADEVARQLTQFVKPKQSNGNQQPPAPPKA